MNTKKKLMLLGVLIISSLSLFSQNVIQNQEFIKIPVPVVRKIVVDLVKGDSAFAQLIQSKFLIDELNNKISVQNGIIVNYSQIDANNKIIVSNLNQKVETLELELKNVSREFKKQKVKSTFTNIISTGLILTLTILIIK